MANRKSAPGTHPAPAISRYAAAVPEWDLPSGEDLIAFALSTGFTMRPMLDSDAHEESDSVPEKSCRPSRSGQDRGGRC